MHFLTKLCPKIIKVLDKNNSKIIRYFMRKLMFITANLNVMLLMNNYTFVPCTALGIEAEILFVPKDKKIVADSSTPKGNALINGTSFMN